MASLLLHVCCGPCAAYCVKHWQSRGFHVTPFWYNPNVHPFTEHQLRLEAMRKLAQDAALPLIVAPGYDVISYFRAVAGHESERCGDCFRLRLSRTATEARERGFEAFTTTLFISPYQKHQLLREVGRELAQSSGLDFLEDDLTSGFRESHRLSREMGLYHQKYCGCLYSEWERFGKVKV